MRDAVVAVVVMAVVACGTSTPKRPPAETDPKSASGDAKGQPMDPRSVVLRVVTSQVDQPADAVAWDEGGVVTADGRAVAFWTGDRVDRTIAFDADRWGWPKSISLLPDKVIGVAAARFDRSGKLIGDPASLAAVMVAGLAGGNPDEYHVRTAAWTADGARVWVGIEQRARHGARPSGGPRWRNLILDAQLAPKGDVTDESVYWSAVAARGATVVTAGGPLSLWRATDPSSRRAKLEGPPLALALSSDGAHLVYADHAGVHVMTADGKERARWDAPDASGVAISSDGAWVATGENERVRLWRVEGDKASVAAEAAVKGIGFALAFAPDDRRMVVGSSPRTVTLVAIEPR